METTIEIFRVILEVCRKYEFQLGHTFRYPLFQEALEYRFHYTKYGLDYLQTPYAKFRLYASGNTETLIAIKEEVLERLGEVITHINGKPVEITDRWDKARYNEELKKHLHLIYDPEDVLFRVSVNEDFYQKANMHYVNTLATGFEKRYGKKFDKGSILMQPEDTIYIQLVGLSVQLYNQI